MSNHRWDDLFHLADAYIEGTMNEEDHERLEALLAESEDARREYLRYAKLHASLMTYASDVEDNALPEEFMRMTSLAESRVSGTRERKNTGGVNSRALLKLVAALVLGFTLAWGFGLMKGSKADLLISAEEDMDEGVAVLTQLYEVEWEEGGMVYHPGDSIPSGTFKIKSGVVQLDFYKGATMILEGPAHLEMLGPDQAFCHEGRMTISVSPHARGFAIATPDYDFVDLGTKFGLSVGAGQPSELHVFSGEVEVYFAGQAGSADPLQTLTTGEATRFVTYEEQNAIDLNQDVFWNLEELDARANYRQSERFRSWEAFSDDVSIRDDVIRYYPFRKALNWERRLENEGSLSDESSHGAIVGSQWESGRWPNKSALRFNRASDRVRFSIPGQYESITLAAWIKIESLKNTFNGLVMTDRFAPGNPHWQITRAGRLQLGIKNQAGKAFQHALVSPAAFKPELFGQWIHVASSYDGSSGRIRHYLNGKMLNQSDPAKGPIEQVRFGSGEFGNWGLRGGAQAVRNFDGAIDEVIIFDRALRPKEIRKIFRAGNPVQDTVEEENPL
ncbi:MAG: LamG-like jellyroll fold domain-containing protein [Verrucomicrobiota bacterium]